MKKDNFYKIIILCLLLINIGMLSFLWFGHKQRHDHPGGPDRIIIERLKLDDQQQKQFEGLRDEHHSQMMVIQKESGELHDQLFALLQKEPADTVAENVLLGQIQQNELRKEQVTLGHFKKLRGILKPEQKPLFDSFVSELSRQIMGPHRGGPPPGDEPPQPPERR